MAIAENLWSLKRPVTLTKQDSNSGSIPKASVGYIQMAVTVDVRDRQCNGSSRRREFAIAIPRKRAISVTQ
jgi:hypothetical protein